jgi:hypothetical protein
MSLAERELCEPTVSLAATSSTGSDPPPNTTSPTLPWPPDCCEPTSRRCSTTRPPVPQYLGRGVLLGALFESPVTLSVLAYAQAAKASVSHLRTRDGDHEVGLIVERDDQRVVEFEVNLAPSVTATDVVHLRRLAA